MRIPYLLSMFMILCLVIAGCSTETELVTIPDNDPFPDTTVPQVVKENYVNKLFISLMGRKPSQVEFSNAMSLMDRDNAAKADREILIDEVLETPEFKERMYEIARAEMLNNLDTLEVSIQISLFRLLLNDPQYADFVTIIQKEIDKLIDLRDIPPGLEAGTLSRPEMHRRMAFNSFYDEINMGSQNFVLAVFEYFLNRYPTQAEETDCITMVDGFNTLVFNREGSSKEDFLEIFFDSDDYYEGQVVDVYNDYLLREPTSVEMTTAAIEYKQTRDYKGLLRQVLATDEYLGI